MGTTLEQYFEIVKNDIFMKYPFYRNEFSYFGFQSFITCKVIFVLIYFLFALVLMMQARSKRGTVFCAVTLKHLIYFEIFVNKKGILVSGEVVTKTMFVTIRSWKLRTHHGEWVWHCHVSLLGMSIVWLW
jgi:hypothetical protein